MARKSKEGLCTWLHARSLVGRRRIELFERGKKRQGSSRWLLLDRFTSSLPKRKREREKKRITNQPITSEASAPNLWLCSIFPFRMIGKLFKRKERKNREKERRLFFVGWKEEDPKISKKSNRELSPRAIGIIIFAFACVWQSWKSLKRKRRGSFFFRLRPLRDFRHATVLFLPSQPLLRCRATFDFRSIGSNFRDSFQCSWAPLSSTK